MGYSPWGHKESDMTEQLTNIHFTFALIIKTKISTKVDFDYYPYCNMSSNFKMFAQVL